MSFIIEILVILLTSVVLIFLYFKWSRQYWAKRKVPYIETNALWGNIENPLTAKRGFNKSIKDAYDVFKKRGVMHGGIYLLVQPAYIPIDPELVKHILAKDFPHFMGHGIEINEKTEPLIANLFNLDGDPWRDMRVQLTPTFTSGKMKMMFNTVLECGVPMLQHVEKICKSGAEVNLKEIASCYTTDIIGSVAFGLECNSFKDPDAEFRWHGRNFVSPSFGRQLIQLTALVIPEVRKWFYVRLSTKQTEAFFINAVKNIIQYRETNNFKRNDFMQLLLDMNEKARANRETTLTLNEIAAQCFVFFVAGFETSSSTMTFCLHELSFNQELQERLREEVRETMNKYDGKLTYDGIMEMKYMDMVVSETLRKYPALSVINRICTKDYQVPNTDVIIEKDTKVFISVLGLHRDSEYYPNPKKFDPERFTKENKAKRPTFAYLPFGEGPRICIGLRFGLMQTKAGIAMLLNQYKFFPGNDKKYEFEYEPSTFITTVKGKILLNAVKLDS